MDENLKAHILAAFQVSPELADAFNAVMGAVPEDANRPLGELRPDQMDQAASLAMAGTTGKMPTSQLKGAGETYAQAMLRKQAGAPALPQPTQKDFGKVLNPKMQPKTNMYANGGEVSADDAALQPDASMQRFMAPQQQQPMINPFAQQSFMQPDSNPVMQQLRGLMPAEQPPDVAPQAQKAAPQAADPMTALALQQGQNAAAGFAEQAAAHKEGADNAKKMLMDFEARSKEIEAERQAFQKDLQDNHIDPDRYMHRMGTGQRISTAIGLLLGGISSGMTGKDNPVEKYLSEQVAHDMKAQQLELGKKENLLSANLKQYGNMADALKMTEVLMNDNIKHRVDMAAAKSNSAQAKTNAQMLKAQIDQKNAILTGQVAGSGLGKGAQASPDEMFNRQMKVLELDGKDKEAQAMRDRYVPGIGLAHTKEGAKAVNELAGTVSTVNSGINDLLKLNTIKDKTSMQARAAAEVTRQSLVGLLRLPLTGPGALNEGERKMLENMIANPTAMLSLPAINEIKLKTLQNRMQSTLASTAKAHGLQVSGSSTPSAKKIDFSPARK